jgi:hypothetical protein
MKWLLELIGWVMSLGAALVGGVLCAGAASNLYLLPAGLAGLAFAVTINPLAIRRSDILHKPTTVAVIAVSLVVVGGACLFGALTRTSDVDAEQAALEKLVGADETGPETADLKLWVMARRPMDEASYDRLRILSTTTLDPKDPDSLHRYAAAQIGLDDAPTNDQAWNNYRTDELAKMLASDDPKMRATLATMNSASPRAKAATIIQTMETKADLEKLLAQSKPRS